MGGVVRTHKHPTHPPTHSHPSTTQGSSLRSHASINIDSDPGLMLEHRNNEKTANAVANKEMLMGDVRAQQQPTHPPTHTHPATIQGFFGDRRRLTVKAILTLMLEHRTDERTANVVRCLTQLGV